MKTPAHRTHKRQNASSTYQRRPALTLPIPTPFAESALGQLLASSETPAATPAEVSPVTVDSTAVATAPTPTTKSIEFPELKDSSKGPLSLPMTPLMDVNLRISVVLGETSLTLGELLKLGEGSVIELNNSTGEPINIYVNDRLYAKGEIVVVDDMFGVRLSEVLDQQKKA